MKAAFPSVNDSVSGEPTRVPRFVPPKPEDLASYFPGLEIIEFVGQGGMGAVYKARQKELDRIVALKILPPDIGEKEGFAQRFTLEARALARLHHPNIVTLFEFGHADGLFFFLMEFVDGMSLRQLLSAGRISPREALAIVPQICDALQFAHDRGIVHRDIKPENVLLDRRGQVKVADFGLAKLVQGHEEWARGFPAADDASPQTGASKIVGTPHYMAPEQMEHPGEVDHRADIYALGVVFYQMLTGELPGGPMELASKKVQIDVRLNEIVLRALEREPQRRYQQASEVKTAVETIVASQEQTPPAPASFEPPLAPVPANISGPANVLLVMGWLGFLLTALVTVRGLSNEVLDLSLGAFGYWRIPIPAGGNAVMARLLQLAPVINLLVILGAFRMRRLDNYPLALIASILSLVALPLWPLSLMVGLWTLDVLRRADVREAFAAQAKLSQARLATPPVFSKLALTAAGLAVLPTIWDLAGTAAWGGAGPKQSGAVWWVLQSVWSLTLGWPALGSVLLAAVAWQDIRRARGSLKGAGWAAFALVSYLAGWVQPLLLSGPGPEEAAQDRIIFGLTQRILTLLGSVALALVVHWREGERLRSKRSASPIDRWLFSRQTAWGICLLASALVLVQLGQAVSPWGRQSREAKERSFGTFTTHIHANAVGNTETNRCLVPLADLEIEVVAVSEVTSDPPVCWRPDGSLLCGSAPLHEPPGRTGAGRSLALTLQLPLAVPQVSIVPFELWIGDQQIAASNSRVTKETDQSRALLLFPVPGGAPLLRLRFSEPIEEWQNTDAGWKWTGELPRHSERTIFRDGEQFAVELGQVSDFPGGAFATWICRQFPKGWTGRLVAVDQAGKAHSPSVDVPWLEDTLGRDRQLHSAGFKDLDLAQIVELRFQVRRGRWIDVRDISLAPGVQSLVQIVRPD